MPRQRVRPEVAGPMTGSGGALSNRRGWCRARSLMDLVITGSSAFADDDTDDNGSARLAKSIVERVAGAAHGADRIDGVAAVERLAQAADMDVDGALVDIDVAAPHAVEPLLAGAHPGGALHQEFEQPKLGRPEIDRAGRARHALLLAVELEVADVEHH